MPLSSLFFSFRSCGLDRVVSSEIETFKPRDLDETFESRDRDETERVETRPARPPSLVSIHVCGVRFQVALILPWCDLKCYSDPQSEVCNRHYLVSWNCHLNDKTCVYVFFSLQYCRLLWPTQKRRPYHRSSRMWSSKKLCMYIDRLYPVFYLNLKGFSEMSKPTNFL